MNILKRICGKHPYLTVWFCIWGSTLLFMHPSVCMTGWFVGVVAAVTRWFYSKEWVIGKIRSRKDKRK